MKRSPRFVVIVLVLMLGLGLLAGRQGRAVQAAEDKKPAKKAESAGVVRARDTVKMLDDLYKNAVVSVTGHYTEKQGDVPAATVAKDVFAAMHKKGYHTARLIDATGKPKNKENVAQTEFEKKAVEEIKGGKAYYEEIGERDGKPVFRAGTIVPAVMKQCAICHGGKEGRLLGVITYELPIK